MNEKSTSDSIAMGNARYSAIKTIVGPHEFCTLSDLLSRAKSPSPGHSGTGKSQQVVPPIRKLPVVIVAGGTDKQSEKNVSGYRPLLIEAFHDFAGTIISGGTRAGICGIVAEIGELHNDTIETIGYVPAALPKTGETDPRYHEIRRTDGSGFSIREPLHYWTDILTSGIPPSEIKLIGINGGTISAAEYKIALLFGATVGIVKGSGRAATGLLADPIWNTAGNLIILPPDCAALHAFIAYRT